MHDFNILGLSVTVQQIAVLSGDISAKDSELVIHHHNSQLILDINLKSNEYFNEVDYSATRYELVVEYENDNFYDLWTMALKVNDLECNDFIIEQNSDYHALTQFIQKHLLQDKLQKKLKEKPSIKQKKI